MGSGGHLKTLTSIVAIDRVGAIGAQNALPWRLKSDLSFFKRTTLDNTIIMGRKTYESIGGCLPNRKNIVLTHNFSLFEKTDNCRTALSIAETLYRSETDPSDEIFVVGGALTYLQFAPLVDRYLVTIVDHVVDHADAFLDTSILNDLGKWKQIETANFPAKSGVDDFPFRVLEISPDDLPERQARRRNLINDFSEQIRSKPAGSARRRAAGNGHQQLSLI